MADPFSDPSTFMSRPWPERRALMLAKFHADAAAAGVALPHRRGASLQVEAPDPLARGLAARAGHQPPADYPQGLVAMTSFREALDAARLVLHRYVTQARSTE